MGKYIYLPYDYATEFIEEGDILLFRGTSCVSRMIQKTGGGPHSHAAIASWSGEKNKSILECVEFREWKGGRSVSLRTQVEAYNKRIDVYRITSPIKILIPRHDGINFGLLTTWKSYNGRAVTDSMRELTGLPYGMRRILWLAKFYTPGLRWFVTPDTNDERENIFPVCSTAVAYAVRKHYTDLVKLRSDRRTEPSDLSRSPLLNYCFTLQK